MASFIRLISSDGQTLVDTLPAEVSAKLAIDEQLILRAEDSPSLQATKIEALGDIASSRHDLSAPGAGAERLDRSWVFRSMRALVEQFSRLSNFEIAFLYDGKVVASTAALEHANLTFASSAKRSVRATPNPKVNGKSFLGSTVPFPEDFDGTNLDRDVDVTRT